MKAFALITIGVMFLIPVLLGTGCSSEGVFENPDSIEVTTFNAIQGKPGHLVTFTIGEDTTGITKRAVLALQDKEVSPYPLYIVFESGNAGLHGLIDLLKNAADVTIVANLPENTEPLTRLWMNSGEGEKYAGFLQIIGSTGTQYLSIRGTLSQERKEWYLRELAKPPTAIHTTPIININEITFEDLNFYIHGDGTATQPATHTHNRQNQQDFLGCVYVPKVNMGTPFRSFAQPLEGVTVTIVSGLRSGESVLTDRDGQYVFKNVQGDALHLLVEKEHFEPKEVIVHRHRQTILANGDMPNYNGDPQKKPGNILIGQAWPDPIRPLLQQKPMMNDLLFIVVDSRREYGGLYGFGMVVITLNTYDIGVVETVRVFAHEIAHARQHAMINPGGGGEDIVNWVNTPEGKAFAEARKKDWDEVGKVLIDNFFLSLVESAAEICAYYWTGDHAGGPKENLKVTAPNRYKWAQEWIGKE